MGRLRTLRTPRAVLLAAFALVAGLSTTPLVTADATGAPLALCGNAGPAPTAPRHVIVVMMENLSYKEVIGSANAPYQTALSAQCGVATSYFGATHTSAANYLAVSAGEYPPSSPPGCGSVRGCADASDNVYSQLTRSGQAWGAFIESMPAGCSPTSSGAYTASHDLYTIGHNPALYYSSIPAAECRANDVGVADLTAQSGAFWAGLQNRTLPAFSFVTPNSADDNDGAGSKAQAERAGDTWLQQFVSTVQQSTSYQSGDTLLLITNDEGNGADKVTGEDCTNQALDLPVVNSTSAHQDSCHVPLLVVYPYTPSGDHEPAFFDHYSITKTVEQLFGLPLLAHAADAQTASLVGSFGIPPRGTRPPPPTVTIATPASGAVVNGTIAVSGTAADAVGVSRVDVSVDGGPAVTAAGTTAWSSPLDTTALADGSHTVSVQATATDGQVGTASVVVTVHNAPPPDIPPVAAVTASCVALTCSFDGTGSTDADGSIATDTWDFGDGGTGTGATVTHRYATAGTFAYSLTVTDDRGVAGQPFQGSVTPSVAATPPVVAIDTPADEATVSGSLTVSGTAGGGSGVGQVTVAVDGGAPQPATGTSAWSATVDTAVLADGPHTLVVQATGGDGQVGTASITVTVTHPVTPDLPPTASATASCSTLTCSFDGSSSTDTDGSVASYSWDFGDGTTGTGDKPSHVYPSAGTFGFTLTVTDDVGVVGTPFRGSVVAVPPAPPTVTIATPAAGAVVAGVVSISGTAAGGTDVAQVDVGVDAQPWQVATGTASWSALVDTTTLADGPHTATVQAIGADGQIGVASVLLTVQNAPPNQPPVAAASATCTFLSCAFDGTPSADPDGTIAAYTWDFGDGAGGTGSNPSHPYAAAGTYHYSLTVTDDDGAVSAAMTGNVTATAPPPPVAFRAAADAYVKSATVTGGASVTTPTAVRAGDTELLVVTTAAVGATGTPAGWTLLAQQTASPLQVRVLRRTATAGDAGAKVLVPVLAASPVALELVDYSGVGPGVAAVGAADATVTAHVTPAVTVATAGSWVVSVWVDKSSTTTAWSIPAALVTRDVVIGTGGGHVTGVVADAGRAVGAGAYPAQTASVVGGPSAKGANLTLTLPPQT